ncbi:bacterio-opsin activator domain-containing protein [Halorubrum sp. BOL3-1]|uniref:bacterio-opsin activator domain-containing protein n=1 Tax=Halorubrum sp. BOL3-1 TaxID=2497325 RepID=UPI0019D63975|nr:bacterio-opsin activator domain-containing protein [Halorubrum sp. BOL3-1]
MEHRLEEAPIGIITVREGTVQACNERAADILATDTPAGDPIVDVFPRSVEGSISPAFDGSSVSNSSFEEYYPTVDQWLSVSVVPGDDAATVYVSDVTEQKNRERTIERLRAESERATVVDRLIADVLQGLIGATSRGAITETIRERLGTSDQYRFAWTGEHVADGDELLVGGVAGEPGETFPAIREAIEQGAAIPERRAVERQQPELIHSVSEDERVPEPLRVAGFADGVQSVLALPLVYGSSVYGVVGVYAEMETAFSDHVRSSFETLGELAGFAINATQNRKLLFADTVTEVTFELASNSPLVRVSDTCSAALTLDGTVAPDEDGLTCFFTVSGADAKTVVETVDAVPTTRDGQIVRREDEEHGRVEVTLDDTVPLVSAVNRGATVRTATFDDGDGQLVVELSPDADVRRLAGALGDDGPATVLARQDRTQSPTTKREFQNELDERLTDRQATALRTAYLADYFRSPRGNTAEEVASSLGITGSTLLHHLRASQRKLLGAFYDEHGNTGL